MKKLYLVDVSSMFFRAFYAIRALSNPQGMPTNAIYGFLSMTIKLLREIRPDYMAFCFDRPEPSFRRDLDARYKAHRAEMPADLVPQVPYVRKLAEALGIACFDKATFEADDVIGSLARLGRELGTEVVIVSGDKDFAQLVKPLVSIYDTMKDQRFDEAGVVEKFGVEPRQMIDYLALVGDASDNVPGVKGIGPKGAQKLLADFGTLQGVYDNLEKIESKSARAKLQASRDDAFLSRTLATITCDIDFGIDLERLRLRPIEREELRSLLLELDFKNFAKTLLGDAVPGMAAAAPAATPGAESGAPPAPDGLPMPGPGAPPAPASAAASFPAAIVENKAAREERMDLARLGEWLRPEQEAWGFWSERGLAIAQGDVVAEVGGSIDELGRLLSDKRLQWKGFDLKEFWKRVGVERPLAAWDQMLAAYVARSGPIDDASKLFALYNGEPLPELPSWPQVYAAHARLESQLRKKIDSIAAGKILFDIELPLAPVLLAMERAGVLIDRNALAEQSTGLARDAAALEKEIHAAAGAPFNVGSPKQLAQVLFEKLKLPTGKKTKTGYSTDNDVLEKLDETHPIARLVLQWRELMKLRSTYVDALPQLVSPADGRVHSTFNQALTTTGRLSSANPNLQNIPIRSERGNMIRKAFVAAPGFALVSADYSQIELRILAHVADDQGLKRAFREGVDVHAATASEVFQVPLSEVTPDLRRRAKAVNFGLAYGQGAFGLADNLGISRKEASEIMQRYFARFSGVQAYMTETVERARRDGYVASVFGRRRYLDELFSKSAMVRKFGERAAINAPIQGTASDIVKMAMIKAYGAVAGRMILQVHDELVYETAESEAQGASASLRGQMESAAELSVPLSVNVGCGRDWEAAHS
jgi:DNA polymerase-1